MVLVDIVPTILEKHRKALDAAMASNPETERRLRKVIRQELLRARDHIIDDARNKMKSDPRGTARAIRTSVYKSILGGNVNIYNSRRAHGSNNYQPQRTLSTRGGNRRRRSSRTQQIMSYGPLDRGFILRFLNAGTGERTVSFNNDERRSRINRGSRGGSLEKYGKTVNTGNRGSIASNNFFGPSADRWIKQAADNMSAMIYQEVTKFMNETK